MVKISVVVPVYNTENYLRECLDSIVNQTFEDIEIICINDGSSDNSLEILKEYEKLDDRITVISQENSGLSITRNNGIKLANGKYIYLIDSDDYLEVTALEELFNISKEKNLDLLIFKLINFDDGNDKKYTSDYYEMDSLMYLKDKVFSYRDIGEDVLNIAVSAPGKFFKKELIKDLKFPENLIFEDNLFFAEVMLNAKRVSIYDKHLYNRRIRQNSITTTHSIKFADSIIIINKIIDLAKIHGVYEDLKYGLAKKKINMANYRYSVVDEEYKEEFFNKVHIDFENYQREYENGILSKLDEYYNCIFRNFITSNNHKEFDLSMKIFDIEKKLKKAQTENKKLKKDINTLKNKNESIMSSNSWKITKPVRFLFRIFK